MSKQYWFQMQTLGENREPDGVWVSPPNKKFVNKITEGDRVAIYVGGRFGGPQSISYLIEIKKRLFNSPTIGPDHDNKYWVKIAAIKIIARNGCCPLNDLIQILDPSTNYAGSKGRMLMGRYLSRRCGNRLDQISQIEFESIARYFEDYTNVIGKNNELLVNVAEEALEGIGQRFDSTIVKKVIEKYAMTMAKRHLIKNGFKSIKNTSKNSSYDYMCVLGNKRYFVEVKGTRNDDSSILLTPNEVKHIKANGEKAMLFLLHDIKIAQGVNGRLVATGGNERVLRPWPIEEGKFEPAVYRYVLP